MSEQSTQTLLMIEPARFGYNEETAVNNHFQHRTVNPQPEALREFQAFVTMLRSHGVNVITVADTPEPYTPDSIFPNNCISFHHDGTVILYPMFAPNRRLEFCEAWLDAVRAQGFAINRVIDYRDYAEQQRFLEGTGSMILDRANRIAYACRAERTDEGLFDEFCKTYDYQGILFTANQSVDGDRLPIYHTNVMMAVAEQFVVICLDAIDDEAEKAHLLSTFQRTGKEIVNITEAQMNQFAGNMLQVKTHDGLALVMSQTAHRSLTGAQLAQIEAYCPIIDADVSIIEENGGGSVRCMMAEVFLPQAL